MGAVHRTRGHIFSDIGLRLCSQSISTQRDGECQRQRKLAVRVIALKNVGYNPRNTMVKRKTIRQKISKKEANASTGKNATISSEDGLGEASMNGASSARLKRKMVKKMVFLSKLQETQRILHAKKVISKKRKRGYRKSALDNLSSLGEVLPSLNSKMQNSLVLPKRNQGKARQQLVVNEVKQLSKVLDHPRFKSSPFTAIHQHLLNTLGSNLEDSVMTTGNVEHNKRNRRKKNRNGMDIS